MVSKMIRYETTKEFKEEDLEALFLSINWESGQFPGKLKKALANYGAVFSAWDGERLVGLMAAMDDGVMTAYAHYLLVHPDYQGQHIGKELVIRLKEHYQDYLKIALCAVNEKVPFYKSLGFEIDDTETSMCLSKF